MKLQTNRVISETEKATKYEFFHPDTNRKCFAWFPNSLTTVLKFGEIKISRWLWLKIKSQL